MSIKENITQIVEEKIASTENFLVEVKVNPGKIIVIIDHPNGVKIEDCTFINRLIHQKLDESSIFEQYELEVGSPGMEEPLKILPQFKKRIGQNVSVLTFDGLKHIGILVSADEKTLELNEELIVSDKKQKEIQKKINKFDFTNIKETRVIFSFDKLI